MQMGTNVYRTFVEYSLKSKSTWQMGQSPKECELYATTNEGE